MVPEPSRCAQVSTSYYLWVQPLSMLSALRVLASYSTLCLQSPSHRSVLPIQIPLCCPFRQLCAVHADSFVPEFWVTKYPPTEGASEELRSLHQMTGFITVRRYNLG